jgi:hypothetical protein
MQSPKPRSTIDERRAKARLNPNAANDRYEPGARDSGKQKERLPKFWLFRSMRECYPPRVRATTAPILPRRHGALCSLPAVFLNRALARR